MKVVVADQQTATSNLANDNTPATYNLGGVPLMKNNFSHGVLIDVARVGAK